MKLSKEERKKIQLHKFQFKMTYTTSPLVAQNNVLIQEYTQHIKSKYYYYDFLDSTLLF